MLVDFREQLLRICTSESDVTSNTDVQLYLRPQQWATTTCTVFLMMISSYLDVQILIVD